MLFGVEHTDEPCPSCCKLLGPESDDIRLETLLPVPAGVRAPLSRKLKDVEGKPVRICYDCAAAEGLVAPGHGLTFLMARIAVGNDRQEMLRLPGLRVSPVARLMKVAEHGDMETLWAWQNLKFATEEERELVRADMKMEKGTP